MEYRTIGYVAGTHGIKGEILVKIQTDFVEERFAAGKQVLLEKAGTMHPYTIAGARPHKGMLLVKLQEVQNLSEVEGWRSCRLCVGEDQLHALDEDEIYYHDLMHMKVEDMNHRDLGEVVEIIESGAHVIIRVSGEKEILIPYVKAFIKKVNLQDHVLTVELIEGML